jgi:type II secretory pathway pseudopilin PulG
MRRKTAGFTLVELLVAGCLFIIIITLVLQTLIIANTIFNTDQALSDLLEGSVFSMDGMLRELRQGSPDTMTISNSGTRIDFFIPASTKPISYYVSNDQFIREHPVNTFKVISNNISAVLFCCMGGLGCADCAGGNTLQINFGLKKNLRGKELFRTVVEKVRLRNE